MFICALSCVFIVLRCCCLFCAGVGDVLLDAVAVVVVVFGFCDRVVCLACVNLLIFAFGSGIQACLHLFVFALEVGEWENVP